MRTNLEYLLLHSDDKLCELNALTNCVKCMNKQNCYECMLKNVKWLLEERKEPILDDVEKEYLTAVIKPFRSRIKHIVKLETDNCSRQYVFISLHGNECIAFPYFKANTMYTGMDIWHNYTLEDLGL